MTTCPRCWLYEAADQAAREVATWPEWMKLAADPYPFSTGHTDDKTAEDR